MSSSEPVKSASEPADAPAGTNWLPPPPPALSPPPPLEEAVDCARPALRKVLRAAFALVAPDGDVEVVRLLGPLAGGTVLAARVDRDAQAADRHAGRRVA